MGMTTVVLIVLALSVRGMSWIDAYLNRREKDQREQTVVETPVTEGSSAKIPEPPETDGAMRAAAIAVAIALARRPKEQSQFSAQQSAHVANVTPTDSWLTEGRARQRGKQGVAQGSNRWR